MDLADDRYGSFSDVEPRPSRAVRPSTTDMSRLHPHVCFVPIVLQKSKVAAVQIFGENLKRKEVDDSHSLSRATEVAHEFGARR
jgi:hypothetical protein